MRLIRTLAARPDLARAVKWHRCSFHYHIEDGRLDCPEQLEQLVRGYHLDFHGDPNYSVLHQGGGDHGTFALRELCAELLVALCPNLEALNFPLNAEMGGRGMHSVARFLASRAQAISPSTLFHNLTHLTLDAGEYAMGSSLDVPAVALILNEAPMLANLRMIRIRPAADSSVTWPSHTVGLRPTALRSLRVLEFELSAFHPGQEQLTLLTQMILQAEKLERFRFSSVPSPTIRNWINPSGLLEVLWPARQTLRHLDLDLHWDPSQVRQRPDLTVMESLDTLKINETEFCEHMWDNRFADSDSTCLSSMLPRSLRFLTVRVSNTTRAWKDIVYLAHQTAAGFFPTLERVTLYVRWYDSSSLDDVQALSWKKQVEDAFVDITTTVNIAPTWQEFGEESGFGPLACL